MSKAKDAEIERLKREIEGYKGAIKNSQAAYEVVLADNRKLHERLEDNFVWQRDKTGKMVRISVEPGSVPDGIECRDEAIKLQIERIRELKAEIERWAR